MTRSTDPFSGRWPLFCLLLLLAACARSPQPALPAPDEPVLLPAPPPVEPASIVSLLEPDSIRAIDDPQFEPAAQAAAHLEPGEQVIGLVINGQARAYPIPILSVHEIVNDVVGNEPIAVTWCPLCYSALTFSRRLAGEAQPLTFAVSGKLLANTLVMFDRETGSLWSQLYGGAVAGQYAGTPLALFPSILTPWATWQQQHPDTLVLSKSATCAQFQCGDYASNPRGSYAVDPYLSYYNRPDAGVVNRQIPEEGEDAGRPKARVLGVRLGGLARAYPFARLAEEPVINDELAGVPIVVLFDAGSATGTAYRRQVDGRRLTFAATEDAGIITDQESGSRWLVSSGQALSGPWQGRRLGAVAATPAFEFGWYGYFPESDTYAPPD